MNDINVVYVSDDNYAMLLGVSLTSLYENNKSVDVLNVYIINDNISKDNIDKLNVTAKRYNRVITYIEKPEMYSLLKCKPDTLKWCDNIFCRLFLPSILEKYSLTQRILYLDCDTVINDELSKLWNIDIGDNVCAAGLECMGNGHKRLIGLEKMDPYVNSGVILLDIDRWRKEQVEEKCQEFLLEHLKTLEYPDEGILNGVLRSKIYILPPEFNLTTLKCTFTLEELKKYRKSEVMYTQEQYNYAIKKPVIIHYTANFMVRRPWIEGNDESHYFEDSFLQYKKKSEWRDNSLVVKKSGLSKRIVKQLFALNRRLGITVCGAIYSYIKPLKKVMLSSILCGEENEGKNAIENLYK